MLVILFIKNPFAKVWEGPHHFAPGQVPSDGLGMNPLLLDPWMIAHPPVLFLGYASSTVIFAYAVAALLRKDYSGWISSGYKWTMFSMLSLGLGIFMGGYWSYTVLGWGGYWGWDPVENSSLVPWLLCIILMHGIMLQQRKSVLKRTNLLFALLYFIFVFYSTFLTRSGLLSDFSVHSFQKSELSLYLGVIMAVICLPLLLFARRFRKIESPALSTEIFNLENMTVFGLIVLMFYSFIIIAGTSKPIISLLLGIEPAPVTVNFYNSISIPMGLMMLLFIILSAVLTAKYSRLRIAYLSVSSLLFAVLINILFTFNPVVLSFLAVSAFLAQLSLIELYEKGKGIILSSRTAHLGIAVMVTGIIISGYYSTAEKHQVNIGQTVKAENIDITLNGFNETEKSTIAITLGMSGKVKDINIPYYIDDGYEPYYKEPYLVTGLSGDIYITPQFYNFSSITYGTDVLYEGEEKEICGMKVLFEGFDTRNMGMKEMAIYAEVAVNGVKYRPGLKHANGETINLNAKLKNSGRTLSIAGIDVKSHAVMINISRSPGDVIPPDYAIFDVSFKRLIWLVWLGTLLITAGIILSLVRLNKKRTA